MAEIGKEDITERPLFALEEQLARQKGILANSILVRKLPDNGAKVRESIAKIEAELDRRRNKVAALDQRSRLLPDIAKLEWALKTTSLSPASSSSSSGASQSPGRSQITVSNGNTVLDSDDDDMEVEENHKQELNDDACTLKLIATSQITQRQAKPLVPESKSKSNSSPNQKKDQISKSTSSVIDVKPDPYLVKLVEKEVVKESLEKQKPKFFPSKTLKAKHAGSSSPALSTASEGSTSSSSSNKKSKWDETLLPPKLNSEGVKSLSMEDTIKISCEKFQQAEVLKATAPPKKIYAYDKLKEQGLLGSYTVAMQTSRPVRPDLEDDDIEDDLSHDSISEESESEESDADNENNLKNTHGTKSRQKTSKDLSSLLNSSLKLS